MAQIARDQAPFEPRKITENNNSAPQAGVENEFETMRRNFSEFVIGVGPWIVISAVIIITSISLFIEHKKEMAMTEGVIVSKYDSDQPWCSIIVKSENGYERTFRMRQIDFRRFEVGQKVEVKDIPDWK